MLSGAVYGTAAMLDGIVTGIEEELGQKVTFVITGGGAAMRGIDALIQRELCMPVRTGVPINVDGLSDERHPEAFASVAGALLYAHRNYEEKSLFRAIFGGFLK